MEEPIYPSKNLTVVIRDDSPMMYCGDIPSYRSVRIKLTDEQISQLKLNWTSGSGKDDYYESISRCFIEP